MILSLVLFVRGSKRHGLFDSYGAQQEQHERVPNPAACAPRHG
jgi:hypothetical protein